MKATLEKKYAANEQSLLIKLILPPTQPGLLGYSPDSRCSSSNPAPLTHGFCSHTRSSGLFPIVERGERGSTRTLFHDADACERQQSLRMHLLCVRSLMVPIATREALDGRADAQVMPAWLRDRRCLARRENRKKEAAPWDSPALVKRRIQCWGPSQNASESEHRNHSKS